MGRKLSIKLTFSANIPPEQIIRHEPGQFFLSKNMKAASDA